MAVLVHTVSDEADNIDDISPLNDMTVKKSQNREALTLHSTTEYQCESAAGRAVNFVQISPNINTSYLCLVLDFQKFRQKNVIHFA